jgi:hypothetical protein
MGFYNAERDDAFRYDLLIRYRIVGEVSVLDFLKFDCSNPSRGVLRLRNTRSIVRSRISPFEACANSQWGRLVSTAVTRREWTIALAIAFVAATLMQTPYAFGYAFAYPKTEFTGLLISIADTSYLAIIRQGYDGAWLYHIQFTPEAHAPAFLFGFYLALGHLARILNLTNVAVWHLARVISALLVFVPTFGFIALFLEDPLQRRVAKLK